MYLLFAWRRRVVTQLGVNYSDARDAVEAIVLDAESYRSPKMYNSIKETDDETLITELARRGYDLSRRRDNQTTAEIVKIS